jgi:predicted MPP superfamily phosphohydrolase
MSIDLISDIHLEFAPWTLNQTGDILVIAGDLGRAIDESYKIFLADVAQKYRHVILISGNHECYKTTIDNGEAQIRNAVADLPNVHYLQCESIVIDEIEFLGCTLWSHLDTRLWSINDGCSIKKFSIKQYKELHRTHRDWLTERLNEPTSRKRVVVTHHLPSYKCIDPKYVNDCSNQFFASHLDDLVPKATLWLAGHTHSPITCQIGGTFVFINPRGYPGENPGDYEPVSI